MSKKYTQEEIERNVKHLENEIYTLKLKRTEISQNINSLKKQVETWLNLDKTQTKLF